MSVDTAKEIASLLEKNELFAHEAGVDTTTCLQQTMSDMEDGADLHRSYNPVIPNDDVEATYEVRGARYTHDDILEMDYCFSDPVRRYMRVTAEQTIHNDPVLNLGSGDSADRFPKAIKVLNYRDVREVELSDKQTIVTKTFVGETNEGENSVKEDNVMIIAPKERYPEKEANFPKIEFAWDGREEDVVEMDANRIVYKRDSDDNWTKTYAYQTDNKLCLPVSDMYLGVGGETRVGHISIENVGTDSDVIGSAIAEAGDLGMEDASLTNLLNTTIELQETA